jgi:hypothetical protein
MVIITKHLGTTVTMSRIFRDRSDYLLDSVYNGEVIH